jgi:hypothetical protein
MVPWMGIEPISLAFQTRALPLSYLGIFWGATLYNAPELNTT